MKETTLKAIFTGAFTALGLYFNQIAIPLGVLTVLMLADYITGLTKAYIKAEISSRTGILGIIKKIGYILIVAVGMSADYLIATAVGSVGIDLPTNFTLGLLVVIWLIVNELISILENLAVLGVPMPKFLVAIISKIKVAVEQKGEFEDK